MFSLILVIHLGLCIGMIFLVLLQQGKGADLGAAFGSGSGSVFGAGGAGNVLTRATTGVAISFMVTSVLLVKLYQDVDPLSESSTVRTTRPETTNRLEGSVFQDEPAPQAAPVDGASHAPATDAETGQPGGDVPEGAEVVQPGAPADDVGAAQVEIPNGADPNADQGQSAAPAVAPEEPAVAPEEQGAAAPAAPAQVPADVPAASEHDVSAASEHDASAPSAIQ